MSEPRHMRGPWHFAGSGIIANDDDEEIGLSAVYNDDPNGRLIIAAPDLYDVVSRLVDAPPACAARPGKAAGYSETDPFDDCDCWACDLVSEARAAIKKAVGP